MTTATIKKAYENLKENADYWTFDNDYKRKYEYIEEVATTDATHSKETLEYIADLADYMTKASKRIFGK